MKDGSNFDQEKRYRRKRMKRPEEGSITPTHIRKRTIKAQNPLPFSSSFMILFPLS
jgi:hypothetical protein